MLILSSYPFHLLFLFHISIYLYSSFYSLFLVVAYQSSSAINQQNSTEHMMCTIAYLCHHVQELFLYCSCLHSTITSAAPHNVRSLALIHLLTTRAIIIYFYLGALGSTKA